MTSDKTLKSLDYFEVMNLLKQEAQNAVTLAALDSLRPLTVHEQVELLQKEVECAVGILLKKQLVDSTGLSDICNHIKRANRGGVLSFSGILAVAHVLKLARLFNKQITEDDYLYSLSSNLWTNKNLEDRIFKAIIDSETLADDASPMLKQIRRDIKNIENKIRRQFDGLLHGSVVKFLQEPIVTIKNGRSVVPVKAENKSEVKGIVHEISATGATLFIEPAFSLELNNEITRKRAEEQTEIQRILADFTQSINVYSGELTKTYEIVAKLDLIFAKASFALKTNAHKINLSDKVHIIQGKHPLIPNAVPLNLDLEGIKTLVITGPNTGGKTVALKTVGLFCAMVAAGLFIPADESSELPIFDQIFADIGDAQSIQQNLSTFSSHMTNIVYIIKNITSNSLALFDELGAGTDPDEGAALAIAILDYSKSKGATTLATTHYTPLKLYAMSNQEVQNGACEFDIETLQPTYNLVLGIPGKSNAFAISQRLGLNANILQTARNNLNQTHKEFETAVANLHKKRRKLTNYSVRAKTSAQENEKLQNALEQELEKQRTMREREIEKARAEAKKIISVAKKEADEIIKKFHEAKSPADIIAAKTQLNKFEYNNQEELNFPKEWQKKNSAKNLAKKP